MQTLRDIHAGWAYFAISANGLVGIAALVAYKKPTLRGRWLWISVVSAQSVMMVQVVVGVILQSGNDYKAPDFHIFYGILAFITGKALQKGCCTGLGDSPEVFDHFVPIHANTVVTDSDSVGLFIQCHTYLVITLPLQ